MRRTAIAIAAAAAVTLVVALAGTAGGKSSSITLKARTAGSAGRVLTSPSGRTLYRLNPETRSRLLCKSAACLGIWRPLTVRSKSTTVKLPSGVSGSIRYVRRGSRFQVALANHPLYTFVSDTAPGQANGQGIRSFGGTWHVISVRARSNVAPAPQPTPTTLYSGYGGY